MTESNQAIQDAVSQLRERALQNDTALFSDDAVWTMDNLRALWVALTNRQSDLRRLESLGEQLRGLDEVVVRLAAELFWLVYLFAGPACINHTRKTDLIRIIYEWSGHNLSPSHPLLGDMGLPRHGGLGLLFSARRSSELKFLIKAVVGIKKLSGADRAALLGDPWATAHMLDEAAGDESPQLSHVLRYLLFPEYFNAIFTLRDKRRIVETFSGIPRKETRRWTITRLDTELAGIRKQLQDLNEGQTLSFLKEPLVSSWRHSASHGDVIASEQRFWVEKSAPQDLPDGQNAPNSLERALWISRQTLPEGADSVAMLREVEPGDVVFHFTDNEGITGVSRVEGEIDEDYVCPDDSPWAGYTGYRLQLTEFAEVTPILSQSTLLLGSKFQDKLRQLADRYQSLFFNRQLTLNRGAYLSEAPEALVRIFDEAYRQDSNRHLPHVSLPEQEDLPAAAIAKHINHPVAQILSGPSGCGKTHTAMVRAVEICDGAASGGHERLRDRYEQLQAEGRIRLVTFHPSFCYADFMERREDLPEPVEDSAAATDSGVRAGTAVRPGVFMQMAAQARTDQHQPELELDFNSATIWKLTPQADADSDDGAVYSDLLEGGLISCSASGGVDFTGCGNRAAVTTRLAEKTGQAPDDETVSAIDTLVNKVKTGDCVILVDSAAACRGIGRISGGYRPKASVGQNTYPQCRPVDWLFIPDQPLPWSRIARKEFLPRMLYQIDLSLLNLPDLVRLVERTQVESRKYVLIIDEIGRGDVDEIFGELVTLIEPDKRTGASNAVTVTMPLSGEQFSVPPNLYLIGTLNSADTLSPGRTEILNRRFQIDELDPDASMIRGDDQLGAIPDGEGGRIDLRSLMLTINRRLEMLVGPEHRLGHGYFMDIQSYQELMTVVRTRVLPHLRTLFNSDWRKVQLIFKDVLKDGQPNSPQVVSHEELCVESEFGVELDRDFPRVRYWMTPERDLTPDAFRKVYCDA